jgi:hypothetical protein
MWCQGLPYTSVITNTTSPVVGAALTGIFDTRNVTNALQARVDFAGVLSVLKKDVPYVDLSSWIGAATSMSPEVATLIQSRTQDPTSLLEEGRKGWPLALLFGENDDSVILSVSLIHSIVRCVCTDDPKGGSRGPKAIQAAGDPRLFERRPYLLL